MEYGHTRLETLDDARQGSQNDPGLSIAAIALTSILAFAWLHPHPLVLPLLSIILVAAALAVSGVIWLRNRTASGSLVEKLHLAGLILFFGFAAAIMGDPDPAVKSLEALK